MSMFETLLNPETLKGIIVVFLIVYFVSGKGMRMIANLIRRAVEGR